MQDGPFIIIGWDSDWRPWPEMFPGLLVNTDGALCLQFHSFFSQVILEPNGRHGWLWGWDETPHGKLQRKAVVTTEIQFNSYSRKGQRQRWASPCSWDINSVVDGVDKLTITMECGTQSLNKAAEYSYEGEANSLPRWWGQRGPPRGGNLVRQK